MAQVDPALLLDTDQLFVRLGSSDEGTTMDTPIDRTWWCSVHKASDGPTPQEGPIFPKGKLCCLVADDPQTCRMILSWVLSDTDFDRVAEMVGLTSDELETRLGQA